MFMATKAKCVLANVQGHPFSYEKLRRIFLAQLLPNIKPNV